MAVKTPHLIHDTTAGAYPIFIVILILGVCGMVYSFFSDAIDIMIPLSVGIGITTEDTDYIKNAILFLFKWSPVWILLGVALYAYTRAQKPQERY